MDPIRTTAVLTGGEYDFSAKYLAVSHLRGLAEKQPQEIGPKTIDGLESLFYNRFVKAQTQAYFLFKEAAGALSSVLAHLPHDDRRRKAHNAFMNLLCRTTGHGNRAAAEALSALPVAIKGSAPKQETESDIAPVIGWQVLLKTARISSNGTFRLMGRSLVIQSAERGELLVVKLGRESDHPGSLQREMAWLRHLEQNMDAFPVRFHIPKPLSVKGHFLFRLQDMPISGLKVKKRHPKGYAIAFLAHSDYFRYPNQGETEKQLGSNEFLETICRNAFLFGMLTGRGIIHVAPVPLFHNRVQGHRRNDQGAYLWERGGRLDRWLWSCCYPNFGCSGIRDFEHFEAFNGPARNAYSSMGAQLLSLFLVAGSYFRMKDSGRVGSEADGRPVDARALFDKSLLSNIVQGVFRHYYHGFVGKSFTGILPFDFSRLADRMVDEMGVDRYMDETLRVADQQEMTDSGFVGFLLERGVSISNAKRMRKGEADITLQTGPHLGGFNQPISIPELIEAVGTMAALSIYGRYCKENPKMRNCAYDNPI